MRQCADYLDCCSPRGEVGGIPWPGGYPLEAYFLPAPQIRVPAPVVVCIGEPGQRKEEFLHKVARYARERGMSLLAVDLLGRDPAFDEIVGRSDLETTLGHIMDYLVEREDVDAAGSPSWPTAGDRPSWPAASPLTIALRRPSAMAASGICTSAPSSGARRPDAISAGSPATSNARC